jgi:hypothetical protein
MARPQCDRPLIEWSLPGFHHPLSSVCFWSVWHQVQMSRLPLQNFTTFLLCTLYSNSLKMGLSLYIFVHGSLLGSSWGPKQENYCSWLANHNNNWPKWRHLDSLLACIVQFFLLFMGGAAETINTLPILARHWKTPK